MNHYARDTGTTNNLERILKRVPAILLENGDMQTGALGQSETHIELYGKIQPVFGLEGTSAY